VRAANGPKNVFTVDQLKLTLVSTHPAEGQPSIVPTQVVFYGDQGMFLNNQKITLSTDLDDFSKRRLVLFNSMNARLFKGFSFNMYGSLSLVRDQLFLAKGGATDDEILLQRRQLSTSYSYFAGVGLQYTFGSIFNNVVNPRFRNAGGF